MTPKGLNSEQKELLRQFAALTGDDAAMDHKGGKKHKKK